MEKREIDLKIAEVSKSVLSYCMARTRNQHDAEDLSQDILLEIARSLPNLRDDKAFYGFLWTVADNVYKKWYKKRMNRAECELSESMPDEDDPFEGLEENYDIYLLRRELALLSEKYRKAMILYYIQNKSCVEIAEILEISESMVKYLLFKARKILKEGMIMTRNYGEQSYNPKNLEILYMGAGPNKFYALMKDNLIRKNILWTCYNDNLTEEEIALQIGVSLPYAENDIAVLTNAGLLVREGNKYRTNIVIITDEARKEMDIKAAAVQETLTKKVKDFISENIDNVRKIGFKGADMSENSMRWLITTMILKSAYEKANDELNIWKNAPKTAFGEEAYVCAEENPNNSGGGFNTCYIDGGNFGADIVMRFMDWLEKPQSDHHDFYRNDNFVKIYAKLCRDIAPEENEFEIQIVAELIKRGYAYKKDGKIFVTMPVFSAEQYREITDLLRPIVDEISVLDIKTVDEMAAVLKNHAPTHLKKQVRNICAISIFDFCIGVPAKMLHDEGYISDNWNAVEIATSYIVLK